MALLVRLLRLRAGVVPYAPARLDSPAGPTGRTRAARRPIWRPVSGLGLGGYSLAPAPLPRPTLLCGGAAGRRGPPRARVKPRAGKAARPSPGAVGLI
jgi:hypothetical protein